MKQQNCGNPSDRRAAFLFMRFASLLVVSGLGSSA